MAKSIAFFVLVLLILLFALLNVHHIRMRLVTGQQFEVRLIYLLLSSYLLGVLSSAYFFLLARLRARRKRSSRSDEAEDEEPEEEFPSPGFP